MFEFSLFCKQVTFKEFYMTPLWLETHASYIDSCSVITANQITFHAGSIKCALLLRIPLVKAVILKDGTPLTVEITVAKDVSIGQSIDSDPLYGVSDGTSFIGIETVESNYNCYLRCPHPCFGAQGTSWETFTDRELFFFTTNPLLCLHLQGRDVLGLVLHCSRWRLHQNGKLYQTTFAQPRSFFGGLKSRHIRESWY